MPRSSRPTNSSPGRCTPRSAGIRRQQAVDPDAPKPGEERIERDGTTVNVYMTAVRSHFNPEHVEVNQGDHVIFHITNVERTQDATHGFAIPGYNINASLEAGESVKIDFDRRQARHLHLLLHRVLLGTAPGNGRLFPGQTRADDRGCAVTPTLGRGGANAPPRHCSEHQQPRREMTIMNAKLEQVLGPRISVAQWQAQPARFLMPNLLLLTATVLLVISIFLPYWHMTLHAPQYPDGLHVTAHLNRLEGDVQEIDHLNHYIGMRRLGEAAQLERASAIYMVSALALLLIASMVTHNRGAALLALPAVLFPPFFLLDLYYWLSSFGQNLDPHAALSQAVKPFTPPVLGAGKVGQFQTVAQPGTGLILAAVASLIILLALWFHRAAYKPVVEAQA